MKLPSGSGQLISCLAAAIIVTASSGAAQFVNAGIVGGPKSATPNQTLVSPRISESS